MHGGNYYDKYGSKHPIERYLVRRFRDDLGELADQTRASHIHEVGCGEGMLIASMAREGRKLYGSDCSKEVIREARLRHANVRPSIRFEAVALETLNPQRHAAELIVCCEVLEHLPDPAAALRHLRCLAQPYLIVSVPREPLWRFLNMLRFRYLSDCGNTPGHVNHWSANSFLSFLARHVQVIETRRPLPWTMALCRVNGSSPHSLSEAGSSAGNSGGLFPRHNGLK
jgi:SAM-dependent methyltransferase